MATYARLGPTPGCCLYVVNPGALVYQVVDYHPGDHRPRQRQETKQEQKRPVVLVTSSAFATLAGHWLCGEERVSVLLRHPSTQRRLVRWILGQNQQQDDDYDAVDVEVLSVSRAATDTVWGRIAWPFIGPMQDSFFQQQLTALQRAAVA